MVGTNQALINVHVSGISCTDVNMNKGQLIANFPNTRVHESTGKIVALGDGRRWLQHVKSVGTHAEYI
jgi:threonine dehydrogenase-like Zn-dependent dehydrogenase